MDPLHIDGSLGEGGGQILRTAVALAARTGRPLVVENVRANRPQPGLRPQHLAALDTVARGCSGKLEGAHVGSTRIAFEPGRVKGGPIHADTGTAGSTTMILHALAPLAPALPERLSLTALGGTDTKWAPSLLHARDVFTPLAARAGVRIEWLSTQEGFYPRGGGHVKARIHPRAPVEAPVIEERGELQAIDVHVRISQLPDHVEERVGKTCARVLQHAGYKVRRSVARVDAPSPGVVVNATARFEHTVLGADALGEKGLRAEEIGERCGEDLLADLRSNATIDVHAADQLVPLLFDLPGSSFIVREVTPHLMTNLDVVARFLAGRALVDEVERGYRVSFSASA